MVILALFYMVIIGLILLLIPLVKKVLNDYAIICKSNFKKFKEEQEKASKQIANQLLEQRWHELDELFITSKKQTQISDNTIEVIQSLRVYLNSILKILKS